ncbi:hypothetical protein CHELA1G11_21669 [Hyphomicrobiales bacterium]|nr:hypothetical protein CHELA1G11_21669 [Hyphomicrobiales bacterium]CAH1695403.1 hypothetical protein CHELA1G2_21974 [Hyphomicrobiales bacterium]
MINKVEANDFCLFRACRREVRQWQIRARCHETGAGAFEEPFRLDADLAIRRLSALQAHSEYLHRIGFISRFLAMGDDMHPVTRSSASDMREARAGYKKARRFWVIERREYLALIQKADVVYLYVFSEIRHDICKWLSQICGLAGQIAHGRSPSKWMERHAVVTDETNAALFLGTLVLDNAHRSLL